MPPSPTENPYASPMTSSGSIGSAEVAWLGPYQPVVMPQDLGDLGWVCLCGAVMTPLVYGIPLGTLAILGASPLWMIGAVALVVVVALLCMSVGVRSIELNTDGILARRWWLGSLVIPWDQVERLATAGVSEVFLTASFRPHRCCSFSMTCRQQIRLETRQGRLLFPPREVAAYLATIRELAAHRNPVFLDLTSPTGAN